MTLTPPPACESGVFLGKVTASHKKAGDDDLTYRVMYTDGEVEMLTAGELGQAMGMFKILKGIADDKENKEKDDDADDDGLTGEGGGDDDDIATGGKLGEG